MVVVEIIGWWNNGNRDNGSKNCKYVDENINGCSYYGSWNKKEEGREKLSYIFARKYVNGSIGEQGGCVWSCNGGILAQ